MIGRITLLMVLSLFVFTQSSLAQCSDLFFSEYIEGSSSNKALEIYNPTGAAVDMSNYEVRRFNNGSLTATDSIVMNGMLAAHDVYIIGNSGGNATILAESDTTHTMTFYNGDDAIVLINLVTGDTLDGIGEIGRRPWCRLDRRYRSYQQLYPAPHEFHPARQYRLDHRCQRMGRFCHR
jgi:predicted extracellular nuclease